MNIGFVSTRFAGTDGVSLEAAKWAEVLAAEGIQSFWFSGYNDRDESVSMCVERAFFDHPEIADINNKIWNRTDLPGEVSKAIRELADDLKEELYRFSEKFSIELLIPENCLAIPMNIPLGIAVTEFLDETGMAAIAHHHDFFWERSRFLKSCIGDVLDFCFPPNLPNIAHTVINTPAQRELKERRGIDSVVIPNVFDFDNPPPPTDDYARGVRSALDLTGQDIIFLQPTRVVPRKGIEHSIELLRRLNLPDAKLVVSHAAGDEGFDYLKSLEQLAAKQRVDFRVVADRIDTSRRRDHAGRKIYTLWDLYPHCDFVTYPSLYEGFGNALLEAIYFKKPVLINRYEIFESDIAPLGFSFAEMDGELPQDAVDEVKQLLFDDSYRRSVVKTNYDIAYRYFSYGVLRRKLLQALGKIQMGSSNVHD